MMIVMVTAMKKTKKQWIRLAKQQTLHMYHALLYISLPSLHNYMYNEKVPNFTFLSRT